jgi:hypothetical protein
MPEQKAKQDTTRMEIGNMVGDIAMGYFGDFTEVPFSRNKTEMMDESRRLMDAGTAVIAEASFAYDGNFCSVDILRKVPGGYEIAEVKSVTGTEDDEGADVKDAHKYDMSYQYYVLTNCGLYITKVGLLQLNKAYRRSGELDLQQLFVLTDCTESILALQDMVPRNIAELKAFAALSDEPPYTIGSRCKDCAYKVWCFRDLPEPNVFDIGWSMWGSKKDVAYQAGYVTFQDVLDGPTPLNARQLMQVKTVVNDLPPHIEPYSIRQFLNGLTYPLYHLDFETYQQHIPLFDGVKPYQQIPFQYSIHIQNAPLAEPTHREYLAKEGEDSRRELAERLCADIPPDVCVLAYYAGFERGRIRELAELFPELAGHLLQIEANIQDLADPFREGHYYRREMGGSYSIKVVLPALCGNDSSLDYKKLDLIQHGSDAMIAFSTLHEQPPDEKARIRAALLAYCKLDTLAMVRVLEKLYEAAESR